MIVFSSDWYAVLVIASGATTVTSLALVSTTVFQAPPALSTMDGSNSATTRSDISFLQAMNTSKPMPTSIYLFRIFFFVEGCENILQTGHPAKRLSYISSINHLVYSTMNSKSTNSRNP